MSEEQRLVEENERLVARVREMEARVAELEARPPASARKRLPPERDGKTVRFSIAGEDGEEFNGYLTVNPFEDGQPGEVFVVASTKEGSTTSGLLDAWSKAFSLALQYGCPATVLCEKFAHCRYAPSGPSKGDAAIPFAGSITDFCARYILGRLPRETGEQ